MFCKWCGNTIRGTDQACPSCGRQTPAMADSGGFYNLKSLDTGTPPNSDLPPIPHHPSQNEPAPQYIQTPKAARPHIWLTVLLSILVVILLVFSMFTLITYRGKVNRLEHTISNLRYEAALEDEPLEEKEEEKDSLLPTNAVPEDDEAKGEHPTETPDTAVTEGPVGLLLDVALDGDDAACIDNFSNYDLDLSGKTHHEKGKDGSDLFEITYQNEDASQELKITITAPRESVDVAISQNLPGYEGISPAFIWHKYDEATGEFSLLTHQPIHDSKVSFARNNQCDVFCTIFLRNENGDTLSQPLED